MQKRSKEKLILNSPFSIFNSKAAFTLAEVLITLTILGVIAAITIPSIQRNFQDRIAITGLRKAFATMDNAIRTMYLIEGTPNKWDFGTYAEGATNDKYRSRTVADKISKYLNVSKITKDYSELKRVIGYKDISASGNGAIMCKNLRNALGNCPDMYNGFIQTKDGVVYSFNNINKAGYVHANLKNEKYFFTLFIDINGPKLPNRLGYDMFYFPVTDKGLLLNDNKAVGANYDNNIGSTINEVNCHHGSTSYRPGYSCGNYVMRHGNMDYKRRDVKDEW